MFWLREAISVMAIVGIHWWIRLTGRRIAKRDAPWLTCPLGPRGQIGPTFYTTLAAQEQLTIQPAADAGLVPHFTALRGQGFDPDAIHPAIRDFYEHTACYRMEAWSEAALAMRAGLWFLTTFVSRRMDQLNFPLSSLELAGGMTSDVLPMVNAEGQRIYTGWLRRLASTNRVLYTGLYTIGRPAGYPDPCVKVSFPVPLGSSTVFLRPEAQPDGSLRLISSGSRFGDPGFYRLLEGGPDFWWVRHLRTLREFFHVYVDAQGVLRTEHTVRFLGLTALRLHYRLERVQPQG